MAIVLIADWTPLERKLPPELCTEFMWMCREGGVEHYKHIITRQYLRLDRRGRCLVATEDGLKEVPFEQEWRRVSGRTGGTDINHRIGRAGPCKGERSKAARWQEAFERSRWPAVSQRVNGHPVLRRQARRR